MTNEVTWARMKQFHGIETIDHSARVSARVRVPPSWRNVKHSQVCMEWHDGERKRWYQLAIASTSISVSVSAIAIAGTDANPNSHRNTNTKTNPTIIVYTGILTPASTAIGLPSWFISFSSSSIFLFTVDNILGILALITASKY